MSIAAVLAAAAAAAAKATALSGVVSCSAVAKGKGLDGIAYVRALVTAGTWTKSNHAAQVLAALRAGVLGPWRWVKVQVDPRLSVWVMHDALAVGDSPPCRIPINESGCQRLADRLGKQLGATLLLPTPRIADAVHLAAVNGGRAIEPVTIWNDPTEPPDPAVGYVRNQGQNVAQWLRQQERLKKAVANAGGYPAGGILSTVGKDVILAPRIVDIAKPNDNSLPGGEAGAKMMIYGWHSRQKPDATPSGPKLAHDGSALRAKGWLSVQQPESGVHADMDTGGDGGMGGFWDYSSVCRLVHGTCELDGKPALLADVYRTLPGLVYLSAPRAVPARYPMLPTPVA